MLGSCEQTDAISFARKKGKRVIEHCGMKSSIAGPSVGQEMLLREMEHRVANSLQLVASVLSLKARTVKSEEARLHLRDASGRLMSIAAVHRQLLACRHVSTIRIDEFLSELSEGLAASLTEKVKLSVFVDGTATIEPNKASRSVSS